jgi:very-short-patch-repair endonuclease
MPTRPRRWRTSATTAQHAKALRKTLTPTEKCLWAKLRNNQLDGLHIRCQEPVNHFIADFYYAPTKLVIEIDGDVHADPEQAAHDAERTAWFIEHG